VNISVKKRSQTEERVLHSNGHLLYKVTQCEILPVEGNTDVRTLYSVLNLRET